MPNITTTGNFTITDAGQTSGDQGGILATVGGNLSLSGADGDLLTINNLDFDVTGTAVAVWCEVTSSDASAGTEITATNSTPYGGNAGWDFGGSGTPPTVVQSAYSNDGITDVHTVDMTGLTSGNMMVLLLHNDSCARPEPTVTDGQGNSWTTVEYETENGSSEGTGIFWAPIGTTGDTTVTVTFSGNEDVRLSLHEVTGQHATPLDASASFYNSATLTHYCASSTEIDTTENVIVFFVLTASANVGTASAPGYTQFTQQIDEDVSGWKTSVSAISNERGTVGGSISRASQGSIASFKAAAGGGGGDPVEQPATFFGCAL